MSETNDTTARTITATATKSGQWWVLEAPELGTTTMLRRLTSADEQLAALAATQLGLDPANIAVHIERQMPAEAAELWQQYQQANDRAEQVRAEATAHRNEAVMALHAASYSPADIAGFTSLSSSRINQIVREATQHAAESAGARGSEKDTPEQ